VEAGVGPRLTTFCGKLLASAFWRATTQAPDGIIAQSLHSMSLWSIHRSSSPLIAPRTRLHCSFPAHILVNITEVTGILKCIYLPLPSGSRSYKQATPSHSTSMSCEDLPEAYKSFSSTGTLL